MADLERGTQPPDAQPQPQINERGGRRKNQCDLWHCDGSPVGVCVYVEKLSDCVAKGKEMLPWPDHVVGIYGPAHARLAAQY